MVPKNTETEWNRFFWGFFFIKKILLSTLCRLFVLWISNTVLQASTHAAAYRMLHSVTQCYAVLQANTHAAVYHYTLYSPLFQACQQRRSQTERMLVPPPHHIEFVDDYVHKGGMQRGDTWQTPWLSIGENRKGLCVCLFFITAVFLSGIFLRRWIYL